MKKLVNKLPMSLRAKRGNPDNNWIPTSLRSSARRCGINSATEETSQSTGIIKQNVPLGDKNWFKTGGNAQYFASPGTPEAFQEAIHFAQENHVAITLVGHGANMLIGDEGVEGLVIQPALNAISHELISGNKAFVYAQTNVSMDALIEYCLQHNLLGLEEFSGIPGSIGGSVYINLHYFQFLLSQFLVSAQVLEKSTAMIKEVDSAWFNFGYNYSTLHEGNHYLLDATFLVKQGTDYETAFAKGRRTEIIRHRASRYPNKNTCGSFFRNFHDHEVTLMSNNKKMIFVAYYLDKIGVKGQLCVGDAIVSYQHANMIVNQGSATSSDIIAVAREMQRLVLEKFGVLSQPECRLIGFKEYPLL